MRQLCVLSITHSKPLLLIELKLTIKIDIILVGSIVLYKLMQ